MAHIWGFKMTKSAKLLRQYECKKEKEYKTDHDLLMQVSCLVRHIIDNDLAHIWIVLKILLGAVVTAVIGGLIKLFLR